VWEQLNVGEMSLLSVSSEVMPLLGPFSALAMGFVCVCVCVCVCVRG
jgi:hypothetical protein